MGLCIWVFICQAVHWDVSFLFWTAAQKLKRKKERQEVKNANQGEKEEGEERDSTAETWSIQS